MGAFLLYTYLGAFLLYTYQQKLNCSGRERFSKKTLKQFKEEHFNTGENKKDFFVFIGQLIPVSKIFASNPVNFVENIP